MGASEAGNYKIRNQDPAGKAGAICRVKVSTFDFNKNDKNHAGK